MKSPLESLPVELFDMIAADFSLPEYQSLRLASQQLYQFVHAKFARLAFAEQVTTLSSSSLNRLSNVSSHQGLRDAVKTLHIRLLNEEEYANLNAISRVGRFPPPKRFPRVLGVRDKNVNDEAATYPYVLHNERPSRLYNGLLKVLKGLPQLKTIKLSMKPSASYIWECNETSHSLFRSKCFEVVIYAITHSNIKLEEFTMARRKGRQILYKPVDLSFLAFQLGPKSLQTLQHCFSNLQSLTLSIMTGYDAPRPDGWASSICGFIAAAPNLKKLTLGLDRVSAKWPSSSFGDIVVKSLAISCRLPRLETLEVINCASDGKDLADLIRTYSSSLQYIVLSHIQLSTDKWCPIEDALKVCHQLRYFRLVAFEDRWTRLSIKARINGRPDFVWDVYEDHQNASDWLRGVTGLDRS
ncbi:hypothetical protein COCC4DRAFT_127593 [Bipolaris maydis ATCC 48331]|uniref:F-box domain-containing protein n=2 Tax=Cochliobolus heterostrophus TaxID=5016 RepID=M2U8U8_COCH5|nr:uncharacterized protein COCC4DRAFT_127593 [Bipolaris maydis ATCC 48331]EMD90201.1 hypothetical protein COCHEDRAFT_1103999 [Bipolaris maydis C5]KAH7555196.1 hypothetical protein BM1_06819 [Bipolaris maydis]ENI09587.1 hypothetical protein COCC4DRAFT_127593 [Bipolaris maydis ATCC 48331]KAJ5023942.1 hypothetical protein J3E73DRAFT_373137 [Bipolaris maydis]KAJ5058103.1 hypothetical protein J3E74DRAFT_221418 [Bipolaris maydis]